MSINEKYSDEVEKLLEVGKEKEYLTYDDINRMLPPDVSSADEIEAILDVIGAEGIQISESDEKFLKDSGDELEKENTDGEEMELDLSAGTLEKTNDPVRMYLREMAVVPLLTRDGEVAIAKRIESHVADAQGIAAAEGDHRQLVVGRDAQHRQIRFRVGADHPRLVLASVVMRDLDLVRAVNYVEIGQNVAFGRYDDAAAETGTPLGLLAEAVAEEVAEDRVVDEGMTCPLHLLAGKDVHHGGYRLACGIGIGGGALGRSAGRRFDDGGDLGAAGTGRTREPFRLEGLDDEEYGHANGDGLGKNEPEAAHNPVISAREWQWRTTE